ncbi:MAG: hypothetical protein NC206_07435 [Bacteroides sp.]|nr:hypothetical protein [Roseburia sp.]MCM1346904.1 hypothetical protein [Bacteroides sp.]MCM1421436.1 hypothetical protein [Bacteroides sp.]
MNYKKLLGVYTPFGVAAIMSGLTFIGCSQDEDFENDYDEEVIETLAEQKMTRAVEGGSFLYISGGSAQSEPIVLVQDYFSAKIHASWGEGYAAFVKPTISFSEESMIYRDYTSNRRIEYSLGVCSASNVGIHSNSISGRYHISYDKYYYKNSSYTYYKKEHYDTEGTFELKGVVSYTQSPK